jgi:PAS domain S-box-containing protein
MSPISSNPASDPTGASARSTWVAPELLDRAPIGIARATVDGKLLYANAALARMLEFDSPAALLAENMVLRYKHPAERAALIELVRQNGVVQDQEFTLLTRSGDERTVLASITLEGDILSSMIVDITARKRAEAATHRQATRLRMLADASRVFAEAGIDYQLVLDQIARTSAEQLDAGCVIILRSDDRQWLRAVTFYDRDPDMQGILQAFFGHFRIHIDDPHPAAVVVRNGQPLLIPVIDLEALRELLAPELWPTLALLHPHSTIIVPLQVHGECIGSISLTRHKPGQPALDEDDLVLAQDLADRAALAIGNTRLFQQGRAELAERKRAEAQVFYQASLLDFVQDAVIAVDMVFRITSWNHAAEALYGWSAAEAIGRRINDLIPPEQLEIDWSHVLEQIQAQGAWRGEVIQRHRDGRAIVIRATIATVRGQAGEPIGFVTVNRDITDRKQAELQLRDHACRLEVLADVSRAFAEGGINLDSLLNLVAQRVVETLCDFCIIRMLSEDGRTLPVVALYYYEPTDEEALGFIRTLVARAPLQADERNIDTQVFQTGLPLLTPSIDLESLKATIKPEYLPGIVRFVPRSMLVVPLRLQDQSIGLLGMYRSRPQWSAFTEDDLTLAQDLADRAALMIENARLFAAAEQARAVAEQANGIKSAFLASMSHELHTPLNIMLGFTGILLMQLPGPLNAEQIKQLTTMQRSGKHLLALLDDMLDLSTIESGKVELRLDPLVCQEVLAEVVDNLRPLAEQKGLGFTIDMPNSPIVVASNPRALGQIVTNLLANAVKFTPAGGQIGLEMRGDTAQQTATITVWDNGIGIDADDLPKLFQIFTQLDNRTIRQYEGTGVGLALVRRLAEAHGGTVAVESTPGQGSRFSVSLPWILVE